MSSSTAKSREEPSNILGRTGGAYIPPARLRQMQAQITDKSSEAYQRIAWEALKKSIHGLINKVNVSNLSDVVRQLLSENVVRGRGLLVRSLLIAQHASPTFTHVFAALVAVVNTKFPQVGELVLKRLITEFRKAFRRNQKDRCLSTARFLAHLVNQKVVHELIVLELLTLLLEQTTDDSVEVSVSVLKECGAALTRLVPKGVHGIFEHLRRILNEGNSDKRIAYMLEVMFQIRRDGWKDHPIVIPELDLIQEDDQITHTTSLLDQVDSESQLNVFRFDADFVANEAKYAQIKASFFDDDDSECNDGGSDEDASDDDSEDVESVGGGDSRQQQASASAAANDGDSTPIIIDQTETNLVNLRRTIYLMLQSSLSADEAGHRLSQIKLRPGEEYELASMVLDCCAQTRSYESKYGRLAQRLCRMQPIAPKKPVEEESKSYRQPDLGPGGRYQQKETPSAKTTTTAKQTTESTATANYDPQLQSYVSQFERIFSEQYSAIHRLETAKLRNVALFFSHLFHTDSISWGVFECVKLNERDTTSSGRIFLKHLLLELCSFMGLAKLQARLRDETLQPYFVGLLPRNNPKDTRFAINFLTTIGMGGLTLDLRDHLEIASSMSNKAASLTTEQQLNDLIDAGSSSSGSSGEDEEEKDLSSSSSSDGEAVESRTSPSPTVRHKHRHRSPTKQSHRVDIEQSKTYKDLDATPKQLKQPARRPDKRRLDRSPHRYRDDIYNNEVDDDDSLSKRIMTRRKDDTEKSPSHCNPSREKDSEHRYRRRRREPSPSHPATRREHSEDSDRQTREDIRDRKRSDRRRSPLSFTTDDRHDRRDNEKDSGDSRRENSRDRRRRRHSPHSTTTDDRRHDSGRNRKYDDGDESSSSRSRTRRPNHDTPFAEDNRKRSPLSSRRSPPRKLRH